MTAYIIRTILQLLFTAAAYVLAPVVAIFCKDDGYLPNWLAWFQTQDAPLDAGWRDGYFTFVPATTFRGKVVDAWFKLWRATYVSGVPTGWNRTALRIRWLWRNPAYGFCYWPLGIAYVPGDWIIDVLTRDETGRLAEFKAHTRDGRYFCNTNSNGLKLGYKLWWALGDDDKLIPVMGANRGPDNRLPICFTPPKRKAA